MGKIWMVLAAIALVAAAFFLPEQLSLLDDRQLLDQPHVIQQEEREGFAERMQLSVAEKLVLMRSATANGTLSGMELDAGSVQGLYDMESQKTSLLLSMYHSAGEDSEYVANQAAGLKAASDEELERYDEELSALWEERLTAVRGEIRTLQAMGGLPELWGSDSQLEFISLGDFLYMDTVTQMSFQVYRVGLSCAPYSLDLTVDLQSGRILTFRLDWSDSRELNWGLRGAVNFGAAWRDYWGLDSVSSNWYSDYTKSILEQAAAAILSNGDYASHGQITFTYDAQSIPVSLECWGYSRKVCSLIWNLL